MTQDSAGVWTCLTCNRTFTRTRPKSGSCVKCYFAKLGQEFYRREDGAIDIREKVRQS